MKAILSALLLFQSLPADTLLFTAKVEGVTNIYELAAGKLPPEQITKNGQQDAIGRCPISSPDGSKIAYSAPDGEIISIFILDTTTGVTRKLRVGPGTCSVGGWSPDGRSIVYTRIPSGTKKSFDPSDADIFVYDLQSDTETLLVGTPFQECGPRFSPDGKYISFSRKFNQRRWIADSHKSRPPNSDFEIYLLDLESRTEKRITDDAYNNWPPVWMPDSGSLIFASDRVSEISYGQLFLLNLDNNSVSQLTDVDGSATSPSISADGKFVAYDYFRRSEDPDNPYKFTRRVHILDLSNNTNVSEIDFGDHCSFPNFRKSEFQPAGAINSEADASPR